MARRLYREWREEGKEEEMGRKVCTKDNPCTAKDGQWTHPDAELLYERDFGLGEVCERYYCPNCGLLYWVAIAQ